MWDWLADAWTKPTMLRTAADELTIWVSIIVTLAALVGLGFFGRYLFERRRRP